MADWFAPNPACAVTYHVGEETYAATTGPLLYEKIYWFCTHPCYLGRAVRRANHNRRSVPHNPAFGHGSAPGAPGSDAGSGP